MKDAVDGILTSTERYDKSDPVNLGSGREISIHDLANTIVDQTEFDGKVAWDTSKPDGQPRRKLGTSRARERIGWEATTKFEEGLDRTIEWYETHREEIIKD